VNRDFDARGPRGPARNGEDPRTAALRALLAIERGVKPHISEWDAADAGLEGSDAGLARELILGCCTYARLYDWLADQFLRPGPQPPELRIALRIAAHQQLALDRIPPHAAVATTVEALRDISCPHLTGVANAVARRIGELRCERSGPGPLGTLPFDWQPRSESLRHGLPELLVQDLGDSLTQPRDDALAALNRRPHLCTRTRPGAPPPTGSSILARDDRWVWWGDPQQALRGPVADGRCVVQDRAQGRVAEAVLQVAKAQPGDPVLDLCAAPGGKSVAMREAGLVVVSADISPVKVGEMPGDLLRVVSDGLTPAFSTGFEVVVVDAPCSNTGVLGRRPEARLRYDRQHRDALVELQRNLLRAAATLVAPGGRLVYSTCSISPPENQGVAQTMDGWRLLGEHLQWPGEWEAGGYYAVLLKS
jgi:16S rRNA (cytosine967-C5)-methyltransferase